MISLGNAKLARTEHMICLFTHFFVEMGSCYIAQAGLEFIIHLPQLFKYLGCILPLCLILTSSLRHLGTAEQDQSGAFALAL